MDGPLTAAAGYAEVVSWDPGGVTKRRSMLRSPTVRGARQQQSTPDKRLGVLRLRIFGNTKTLLDAHVQDWLNAFNQTRYQTTVTINSVDTTWKCDDADYAIVSENGDGIDKFRLRASPMRQIYVFQIPLDPDPVAGVI